MDLLSILFILFVIVVSLSDSSKKKKKNKQHKPPKTVNQKKQRKTEVDNQSSREQTVFWELPHSKGKEDKKDEPFEPASRKKKKKTADGTTGRVIYGGKGYSFESAEAGFKKRKYDETLNCDDLCCAEERFESEEFGSGHSLKPNYAVSDAVPVRKAYHVSNVFSYLANELGDKDPLALGLIMSEILQPPVSKRDNRK